MPAKRTLDSFFLPTAKARKISPPASPTVASYPSSTSHADSANIASTPILPVEPPSTYPKYPFPVPALPSNVSHTLSTLPPTINPKPLNHLSDLDVLYYAPYFPPSTAKELFNFLRQELFFYRVEYQIRRGGVETRVKTPRYTTVFGVDATSTFSPANDGGILDVKTKHPVPANTRYRSCSPRPIPGCLDAIRRTLESHLPGSSFNFCLVNYYANGTDSISPHSDDERFLGPDPIIASFSLGQKRDFILKRKLPAPNEPQQPQPSLTLPLASGDMLVMRGPTQAKWLHSLPKRKGKVLGEEGRINITFRKAMTREGTENYYHYNVGAGGVWTWDSSQREMKEWRSS